MKEQGTKIRLVIGEAELPATLNDCVSSQALLSRLPCTVRLQRYDHDYCGVMDEPLPYDAADLRRGWKNGDIAFAVSGAYFAILYKDEAISLQYDGMVTLGALDCPPEIMENFKADISVRLEPVCNKER